MRYRISFASWHADGMRKAFVVATLKQRELSLREQGVAAIYLFGSVARDTQTASSDVDLAFDLAPAAIERFSLIDQSRIQRELAGALGIKVDLIERAQLRPRVSDHAERDMIQIF
jgi:predicted nucleotidyltransferase